MLEFPFLHYRQVNTSGWLLMFPNAHAHRQEKPQKPVTFIDYVLRQLVKMNAKTFAQVTHAIKKFIADIRSNTPLEATTTDVDNAPYVVKVYSFSGVSISFVEKADSFTVIGIDLYPMNPDGDRYFSSKPTSNNRPSILEEDSLLEVVGHALARKPSVNGDDGDDGDDGNDGIDTNNGDDFSVHQMKLLVVLRAVLAEPPMVDAAVAPELAVSLWQRRASAVFAQLLCDDETTEIDLANSRPELLVQQAILNAYYEIDRSIRALNRRAFAKIMEADMDELAMTIEKQAAIIAQVREEQTRVFIHKQDALMWKEAVIESALDDYTHAPLEAWFTSRMAVPAPSIADPRKAVVFTASQEDTAAQTATWPFRLFLKLRHDEARFMQINNAELSKHRDRYDTKIIMTNKPGSLSFIRNDLMTFANWRENISAWYFSSTIIEVPSAGIYDDAGREVDFATSPLEYSTFEKVCSATASYCDDDEWCRLRTPLPAVMSSCDRSWATAHAMVH